MGGGQGADHRAPYADRLARRQPAASADVVAERDALDVCAHDVGLVAPEADRQWRCEHRGVHVAQNVDLVLQARPICDAEPGGGDGLDHHRRLRGAVLSEERDDAAFALQDAQRLRIAGKAAARGP